MTARLLPGPGIGAINSLEILLCNRASHCHDISILEVSLSGVNWLQVNEIPSAQFEQ